MNNPKLKSSPWGAVQHQSDIAEGIAFVSTAGHGGYWFADQQWQRIVRMFPLYEARFAPPGWLEEDCDCALAPLAFPEHFSDEAIFHAVRMIKGCPDFGVSKAAASFLFSPEAAPLLARAEKHAQAVARLWERGSCGTVKGGWWVSFSRGTERREVIMPDYPAKNYYSDEELAGLPTGEEKEAA